MYITSQDITSFHQSPKYKRKWGLKTLREAPAFPWKRKRPQSLPFTHHWPELGHMCTPRLLTTWTATSVQTLLKSGEGLPALKSRAFCPPPRPVLKQGSGNGSVKGQALPSSCTTRDGHVSQKWGCLQSRGQDNPSRMRWTSPRTERAISP